MATIDAKDHDYDHFRVFTEGATLLINEFHPALTEREGRNLLGFFQDKYHADCSLAAVLGLCKSNGKGIPQTQALLRCTDSCRGGFLNYDKSQGQLTVSTSESPIAAMGGASTISGLLQEARDIVSDVRSRITSGGASNTYTVAGYDFSTGDFMRTVVNKCDKAGVVHCPLYPEGEEQTAKALADIDAVVNILSDNNGAVGVIEKACKGLFNAESSRCKGCHLYAKGWTPCASPDADGEYKAIHVGVGRGGDGKPHIKLKTMLIKREHQFRNDMLVQFSAERIQELADGVNSGELTQLGGLSNEHDLLFAHLARPYRNNEDFLQRELAKLIAAIIAPELMKTAKATFMQVMPPNTGKDVLVNMLMAITRYSQGGRTAIELNRDMLTTKGRESIVAREALYSGRSRLCVANDIGVENMDSELIKGTFANDTNIPFRVPGTKEVVVPAMLPSLIMYTNVPGDLNGFQLNAFETRLMITTAFALNPDGSVNVRKPFVQPLKDSHGVIAQHEAWQKVAPPKAKQDFDDATWPYVAEAADLAILSLFLQIRNAEVTSDSCYSLTQLQHPEMVGNFKLLATTAALTNLSKLCVNPTMVMQLANGDQAAIDAFDAAPVAPEIMYTAPERNLLTAKVHKGLLSMTQKDIDGCSNGKDYSLTDKAEEVLRLAMGIVAASVKTNITTAVSPTVAVGDISIGIGEVCVALNTVLGTNAAFFGIPQGGVGMHFDSKKPVLQRIRRMFNECFAASGQCALVDLTIDGLDTRPEFRLSIPTHPKEGQHSGGKFTVKHPGLKTGPGVMSNQLSGPRMMAARIIMPNLTETGETAKDAELAAKEAELAAKKAELAAKEVELAAKEAKLAAVEEELVDKGAELDTAKEELADKAAELADKDAELADIGAKLDAANERLVGGVNAANEQLEPAASRRSSPGSSSASTPAGPSRSASGKRAREPAASESAKSAKSGKSGKSKKTKK